MPHPIDIIRKLHNFPDDVIERVRELMVEETVRKGYCIESLSNYHRNTAFYIRKGAARTFYIDKGRECTLSFAFDDDFIMTHTMRNIYTDVSMTVMFLEDTQLVSFRHSDLHEIIQGDVADVNPLEWSMFLNAVFYEYAGDLEGKLYFLCNSSARERYEWVLRRYPRITDVATMTQIASFLNITKETLYRIRGGKYSAKL